MIKKYKVLKKQYKIHEETGNYYDHPSAIEEASKLYLDTNSIKPSKNKYCLRSIIYPKDIAFIYGDDSPDFARYLLMKIRRKYGLPDGCFVTYPDFCDYTGLDKEIVNPVSRSYSINRWVEKYGHSHCDETIYDDLYKIRWTEMSHSASIWIDYLDINNNAIDGEWYLNELKANEVMKVEYGYIENAWEEQEFRAPKL